MPYVSQLGKRDLVYDYLIISPRESGFVPDMNFFAIPSLILSHFELSRIELPKLTSSILMQIVTIPAAPGRSITFSYALGCLKKSSLS